MAPQNTILTCL